MAYALYAVVVNLLREPLDAMMQAQLAAQRPPPTAADPETAQLTAAITAAMAEAFQTVYAYGAYFAVLIIVPFGLATRWLLGDRGRTVAEGAVLGAYVEVAVVLPSMLLFTPLSAFTGAYWVGSVPLALYVGYAAWGSYQFFDRTPASAALTGFSMVLGLIVYFGLLMAAAVAYGFVLAVRMHGGG